MLRTLCAFVTLCGFLGTDFPVIEFRRATAEVKELKLKEASRENLMWRNAARLYDLKPEDGFDWTAK